MDHQRRPVMFYNHGGGFTIGSGSTWYQNGFNIAREYDVVVVSNNHHLGLLEYLFLGDLAGEEFATSGNQGILDIAAAVRWVHENIQAFGGDVSVALKALTLLTTMGVPLVVKEIQ